MIFILEGLYLGDGQAALNLDRLLEVGITHVVNCALELPNYHEPRFEYLALRLTDPDPRLCQCLPRCWSFLDRARQQQGRVLVHCLAAISRSPTIVLSYLCHLGLPLDEAAKRLGQLVWTDPDELFLTQLAQQFGYRRDREALGHLRQALHGKRVYSWDSSRSS